MAKANSENNDLKKVLTHLTALDKKVDKGFKKVDHRFDEVDQRFREAAEDRQNIRNEVDQRFREAAEDRQNIRNEVQVLRHGMQLGFKSTEESQKKTEAAVAGLYIEIPKMGSELYDKILNHHKEFQEFQQDTLSFQKRTEGFQQQTLTFQEEMLIFKQQTLDFQRDMRDAI